MAGYSSTIPEFANPLTRARAELERGIEETVFLKRGLGKQHFVVVVLVVVCCLLLLLLLLLLCCCCCCWWWWWWWVVVVVVGGGGGGGGNVKPACEH